MFSPPPPLDRTPSSIPKLLHTSKAQKIKRGSWKDSTLLLSTIFSFLPCKKDDNKNRLVPKQGKGLCKLDGCLWVQWRLNHRHKFSTMLFQGKVLNYNSCTSFEMLVLFYFWKGSLEKVFFKKNKNLIFEKKNF